MQPTPLSQPTTPTPGIDLDRGPQFPLKRILVIDDDVDFLMMVKIILRSEGFDVASASAHKDALAKCIDLNPDLILVDLMMPEVDGWGIQRLLREVTHAPIIVISASANRDNAARSLDLGADDYISKPFHKAELVSRIRRLLRQSGGAEPSRQRYFPGIDLRVDLDTHQVSLSGRTVYLLPREFNLLAILMEYAPRSVSYETITRHIWGEDNAKNRSHLKTIAFGLRQKLEVDPAIPELIVNYRSLGYQLVTRA
jgi:DNA-binding response OmpR family regulator